MLFYNDHVICVEHSSRHDNLKNMEVITKTLVHVILPSSRNVCSIVVSIKLKSSLRKFCGRHHDLVDSCLCHKYSTSCNHNVVLSSFITYHYACNKSNTTGVTCGTGTA